MGEGKIMSMQEKEILIKRLQSPKKADIERDTEWICASLGFVTEWDREKTASRIFREVLKAASRNDGLTSEELSKRVDVTRGAVIHHINNYIGRGLMVHDRRRYFLRNTSLEQTIEELEVDVYRIFQNLKKIAREIDSDIGLSRR